MFTATEQESARRTLSATPARAWRFSRREKVWLAVAFGIALAFGANVEQRTALRRTPMTDLGVFACAAGAVRSGQNLYAISDWHGWHYQYPPALAILFTPLQHPVPVAPVRAPGAARTAANTPWGYAIDNPRHFYGLRRENARFFCIVAAWYIISVALICLSAQALACALEGRELTEPPPLPPLERRRWWMLRGLPLLICAGSIGTDLSRGQVDVLMLAAMAFGLYLAVAGRNFKAGFWLAWPATLKLFPGMLLIYPIWRGRWRMAAGVMAGLFFALAVLPAAALGPARSIALYKNWLEVLVKPALGAGSDTSRIHELTGMESTDNQSLLAFIHNWRYQNLRREQRPAVAANGERYAVYAIGAALLLGAGWACGIRRHDSPSDLLIIAGLLMGLALAINPVSHNYYYLLLLPLVAALLDRSLKEGAHKKLLGVLAMFALTDLAARLPGIGPWLRDHGLPLLSMGAMLWVGAMELRRSGNQIDSVPLGRS